MFQYDFLFASVANRFEVVYVDIWIWDKFSCRNVTILYMCQYLYISTSKGITINFLNQS